MKFPTLIFVTSVFLLHAATALADPVASLARDIAEFKSACPTERISVAVHPVFLASQVEGAIVKLTSSQGMCFGQVGENDYLVAHRGQGPWRVVMRAEPGIITTAAKNGGWPRISLQSLGQCRVSYEWNGVGYRVKQSRGCRGLLANPNLDDLARIIRGG